MLRRGKQASNRDPARLSMLVWARQHPRISGRRPHRRVRWSCWRQWIGGQERHPHEDENRYARRGSTRGMRRTAGAGGRDGGGPDGPDVARGLDADHRQLRAAERQPEPERHRCCLPVRLGQDRQLRPHDAGHERWQWEGGRAGRHLARHAQAEHDLPLPPRRAQRRGRDVEWHGPVVHDDERSRPDVRLAQGEGDEGRRGAGQGQVGRPAR